MPREDETEREKRRIKNDRKVPLEGNRYVGWDNWPNDFDVREPGSLWVAVVEDYTPEENGGHDYERAFLKQVRTDNRVHHDITMCEGQYSLTSGDTLQINQSGKNKTGFMYVHSVRPGHLGVEVIPEAEVIASFDSATERESLVLRRSIMNKLEGVPVQRLQAFDSMLDGYPKEPDEPISGSWERS
jgi:hypothetical protein